MAQFLNPEVESFKTLVTECADVANSLSGELSTLAETVNGGASFAAGDVVLWSGNLAQLRSHLRSAHILEKQLQGAVNPLVATLEPPVLAANPKLGAAPSDLGVQPVDSLPLVEDQSLLAPKPAPQPKPAFQLYPDKPAVP